MEKAKEELRDQGYSGITRTAERECYDYTCERNGNLYFVEVKGTQTRGASVILTRKEVEHMKLHRSNSIFVIVHSIRVRRDGSSFDVSEGTIRLDAPWILNSDQLEPISFKWAVPGM